MYQEVMQDVTLIYSQNPKLIPNEKRPETEKYLDLIYRERTRRNLKEQVIDSIILRWQQFGYLRELYLDEETWRQYENFRHKFPRPLSKKQRAKLVKPGLSKPSHSLVPRKDRNLDPDFKARFHRSVCLNSLALVSRLVGQFSMDEVVYADNYDGDDGGLFDEISNDICDAWSKQTVVIGGNALTLNCEDRLDCMEVWDFLYMFLLQKVFPRANLSAWTENDLDDWPFQETFHSAISSWYSFLDNARWAIQPQDLVDLIQNEAWDLEKKYPADRSTYLKLRGVFDLGYSDYVDWYSMFERSSIVQGLVVDVPGAEENFQIVSSYKPCWWDEIRANFGSPFQPDFLSKFTPKLNDLEAYRAKALRNSLPSCRSTTTDPLVTREMYYD